MPPKFEKLLETRKRVVETSMQITALRESVGESHEHVNILGTPESAWVKKIWPKQSTTDIFQSPWFQLMTGALGFGVVLKLLNTSIGGELVGLGLEKTGELEQMDIKAKFTAYKTQNLENLKKYDENLFLVNIAEEHKAINFTSIRTEIKNLKESLSSEEYVPRTTAWGTEQPQSRKDEAYINEIKKKTDEIRDKLDAYKKVTNYRDQISKNNEDIINNTRLKQVEEINQFFPNQVS